MKKHGILNKLKKMLIVVLALVTLSFSMPQKSKAGIVDDFLDLILRIPDGFEWMLNKMVAGTESDLYRKLNLYGFNFSDADTGRIYHMTVTPFNVITSSNKRLPLFDVDFFGAAERINNNKQNDIDISSAEVLAPTVGSIYMYLRNLCLVLMLIVLMYVGIRILYTSIATEQAKYKQYLIDWVIGFCLLFCMHFIMSFLMNINKVVLHMLSSDTGDTYYIGFSDIGEDDESNDADYAEYGWFDAIPGVGWAVAAGKTLYNGGAAIYNATVSGALDESLNFNDVMWYDSSGERRTC